MCLNWSSFQCTATSNCLYLQYKSDADPALYINPEQPLIAATNISQDDIEKQEARVVDTRKKLAQAIEALYG